MSTTDSFPLCSLPSASEGGQDPETYRRASLAGYESMPFPPLPLGVPVQQPVVLAMLGHQCPPLPQCGSYAPTSTLVLAAWAILANRYNDS
jgi:hypothetical protein